MNGHPLIRPVFSDDELQAVKKVLDSGWVTQGPEGEAFEADFKSYTQCQYATAVSNCTAALHLALQVVGVKDGDEVIVPSSSFVATSNAIRYLRATPVFVDISLDDFNISFENIQKALSKKTVAILCVHQMGMPCQIESIAGWAKKNALFVVEDAACALGSEVKLEDKWVKIGRPIGDVVCFSFHPRKLLTTGDGGMLTTNNSDFDKKFKLLRQHCMEVNDRKRHLCREIIVESYSDVGYNYRLSDIQAAIGRVQLTRLDAIVKKRRKLAKRYQTQISQLDGVTSPKEGENKRSNFQSFCVLLDDKIDQHKFMQYLKEKKIATRPGIMCAHLQKAYPKGSYRQVGELSMSEKLARHGVILPLYHEMSPSDIDTICDEIKKYTLQL